MKNIKIEVELLSETIFGCGEAVSNSIDIEVLKDDIGIPYMKGKTFKGKLREEVEAIVKILKESFDVDLKERADLLFGVERSFTESQENILDALKFSNCTISKNIKNALKNATFEEEVLKEYILSAFTNVITFTSLDENGIAKDGSLREARAIKKSFKYYVDIHTTKKLDHIDKGLICMGASALRNLGTMESRGKGHIICRYLEDGEDKTKFYIDKLEKELI